MLVSHLINKYSWNDISQTMERLYPGQLVNAKGYNKIIEYLKTTKPIPTKYKVCLSQVKDEDSTRISVYGLDNEGISWSLPFIKTAECLNMQICFENKFKHTQKELLCHILWEMTYMGFETD